MSAPTPEPRPELPLGSAALPGCGGMLKQQPEDFVVEEVPAYAPSGQGDHLYLWVQKRGMSAPALLSHVARGLQVQQRDIGCAGLKDRQAVTRQFLSVPARQVDAAAAAARLDCDQVQVLHTAHHGNKLKTGHLRGNRFIVQLRGCGPGALARAEAVLAHIARWGCPNYYGLQRFGRDGDNAARGRRILAGDADALADVPFPRRKLLRRLCLSALQSELFNDCLGARLADGLLHRVLLGDVLAKRSSGGLFICEDVVLDQARVDAGELVPTGPMFGVKMRAPTDVAAARETALLAAAGLAADAWQAEARLMSGSRRALTVWPDELDLRQMADDQLQLTFALPPGSYATVLLQEIMKG